jgi:tripartite ATP-independent transporter DctP family solute receptor
MSDTTKRAADYAFVQYHNQSATGTLHEHLVAMWDAIRAETGGRVEAVVHAENNRLAAGDPAVMKMLLAGEIQFFTLMGGGIGATVPVAEIQQVPFAFKSAAEAHDAIDGPLGRYVGAEMAAKGLYLFPVAGFDNGMRQITALSRPVRVPDDFVGMKVRTPPSELIMDTFKALGAEPVPTLANQIYASLRDRKVDAQENPLAVMEAFGLDALVRFVSLTNHMWSGFNQMAHLPSWARLPDDIKSVIERNVATFVRRQRIAQAARNADLRNRYERQGIAFNAVDPAPFRGRLGGVYAAWKERLGRRCWSLLEEAVGPLR